MAVNDNGKSRDKLIATLYKKALGYTCREIVEEYSGEEKGGELLKRKITSKPVPPDIAAIKTYLEIVEKESNLSTMSDDELECERDRLIKMSVECSKIGT